MKKLEWIIEQYYLDTTVGIIGGADGPTSIFLTGKIGSQ